MSKLLFKALFMKGRLFILVLGATLLLGPSVSFAGGNGPPATVESKTYDMPYEKAVVEPIQFEVADLSQLTATVDKVNARRSDIQHEAPAEASVKTFGNVWVSNIGYRQDE